MKSGTDSFRAFRIHKTDDGVRARFETLSLNDLSEGNVVVRVTHSTVNYKDALAATGTSPILRRYPLVGGIDLAGTVESSDDSRFSAGQRVLVNGCGLSETRDGGYSEFARLDGDSLVAVPESLTNAEAMRIGTAGFTAALAIDRMQHNGQHPDMGPILVTGASGGVGSLAIDMLATLGFEVHALSGKTGAVNYLKTLGASTVINRNDIDFGRRPLEATQFGGAIDNLGGDYLAWLTRTVGYGGNIASIGLAASHKLETTVMPFILRAVNLLGINSVDTPRVLRQRVWQRLGDELRPRHLATIGGREISFDELPSVFQDFVDSKVTGRVLVHIT